MSGIYPVLCISHPYEELYHVSYKTKNGTYVCRKDTHSPIIQLTLLLPFIPTCPKAFSDRSVHFFIIFFFLVTSLVRVSTYSEDYIQKKYIFQLIKKLSSSSARISSRMSLKI